MVASYRWNDDGYDNKNDNVNDNTHDDDDDDNDNYNALLSYKDHNNYYQCRNDNNKSQQNVIRLQRYYMPVMMAIMVTIITLYT